MIVTSRQAVRTRVGAASVRFAVVCFCLATSVYACIAYSAFAYQQFLRPRMFLSVARFSDWHAALYWVWLAAACSVIRPLAPRSRPGRWLALTFVVTWFAVGVFVAFHPVLPALHDSPRSAIVALVALLPVIWIAAIDLLDALEPMASQARRSSDEELVRTDTRLLAASAGTAVFAAILYAVLTPIKMAGEFEPDLLTQGLTEGLLWSLADHLVIFTAAFIVLALVHRLTNAAGGFARRYLFHAAALSVALVIVVQRTFGDAIGVDDGWGRAVSAALGVAIVCAWAGARLHALSREAAPTSPLDLLFGWPSSATGRSIAGRISAIAIVAYVLAALAGRLDWDFLLLELGVLCVWVAMFLQLYSAMPAATRLSDSRMAVLCAIPLALHTAGGPIADRLPQWLGQPGSTVRHTLDRYLVYNPTFRVADAVLRDTSADEPSVDRYLRANTGLSEDVTPISVDFVRPLVPSPVERRPLIFLFVIDSLRPDYLAPYNEKVSFTPRLADFAAESTVFRNAFTRYGGTGLAMPSIWMGAAGVHKQYVHPFQPLNALEKLIDGNAYQRIMSFDHITSELFTPNPSDVELDRGVPELSFKFCDTLGELQNDLVSAGARPVFAQTRTLDLHVSAIRSGAAAPGELYPGFQPAYASRVHRIDACFGGFVDFLKRRDLYDRSVIVVMSDHGESLGEDGRWGHVYYLFPEVLRIPLIIHVPPAIANHLTADPDATALATDVVPTLYTILGYRPLHENALMGRSLFTPPSSPSTSDDLTVRREPTVVAASYGAVWGVLRQNSQRLYIVDANHDIEYAYRRPADGPWTSVAVTDGYRAASQRAIRQHVEELAERYRLSVDR